MNINKVRSKLVSDKEVRSPWNDVHSQKFPMWRENFVLCADVNGFERVPRVDVLLDLGRVK